MSAPDKAATATPTAVGAQVIATLHAGWLRRIGVPLVFWVIAFLGSALANGMGQPQLSQWAAIGFGALGLVFGIGLWRRKAVLTRESVTVRNLFRTQTVRFADLQAFTYDARRYRFYLFLPIGRVAKLRLKGSKGLAVFHAGFARFDAYAPILIDLAVEATVRHMREHIDRGEIASFGRRLLVSREQVIVKGMLYGQETAAIDELRTEVADGEFRLSSPRGELGRFALRDTPNLLALPQLVEELSVNRGRPRPAALQEALRMAASP